MTPLPAWGFGTAPLGRMYADVGDHVADAALVRAWDLGVRYFDTAPRYGNGRAETRLGRLLASVPRGEALVSTKVGWDLVGDGDCAPAWSPSDLRRSLEGSLTRLGTDRVDVVFLHDPDLLDLRARHAAFDALGELRDEGLTGAVGVAMNQTAMLEWFVRHRVPDVVLVAGRYTLLDTSAADALLPACAAAGTRVVAGGVFNSGVLADPDATPYYDYHPAPETIRVWARGIAALAARHDVPIATAAMRFPLRHPAVGTVVLGMRASGEVDAGAAAMSAVLPEALWEDLGRLRHPGVGAAIP